VRLFVQNSLIDYLKECEGSLFFLRDAPTWLGISKSTY